MAVVTPLRALLLVVCAAIVSAYPRYQGELPAIPANNPGVGHINPTGGGGRNQFGIDFKNAGYTWTKALCEKDSDGDGKTNGQELGDPGCTWKKGQPSRSGPGITHPGVKN